MSLLENGQIVGRYRIVRHLGSGAMGEVYLAEDPQIERLLAIKTVRLQGAKSEEAEERKGRLLREAKAAGRLIHPHIVTLFDAGEEEGLFYLAFEYVDGSDLAIRMETPPPLTLGQALGIVRQAAQGLEYAHRMGVIHRDIKPSNLLLDREGRVKVSDFGIAKLLGQATELTMTGSVVGSPHYLSPEQVRGEDLDGRSDLFSLGVVLYELLSRSRPFQGETLTTLVYQILHREPLPLSQLRSWVPPRLEELVRRMLQKDREARFVTAGEVAAEVAAIEEELPGELLEVPLDEPEMELTRLLPGYTTRQAAAGAPPRKRRTGLLVAAVLAAGLVTLLVVGAVVAVARRVGVPPVLARLWKEPAVAAPAAPESPPNAQEGVGWPSGEEPGEEVSGPTKDRAPGETEASSEPPAVAAVRPEEPAAVRPPSPVTETPRERAEERAPSKTSGAAGPRRESRDDPQPSSGAAEPPRREAPVPAPGEARPAADPSPHLPPASRRERQPPRVDQELTTGLRLELRVTPQDAFVLLDRRVMGRAREWSSQPFVLPGSGEYLLTFRKGGMGDHHVRILAREGGPLRRVAVRLRRLPAEEIEIGDLVRYQVREGVAFRVEPEEALVLVDGKPVGRAGRFRGRLGRPGEWLRLDYGVHRISLVAPGFERVDLAVDVSPGARKRGERIEIRLPREED